MILDATRLNYICDVIVEEPADAKFWSVEEGIGCNQSRPWGAQLVPTVDGWDQGCVIIIRKNMMVYHGEGVVGTFPTKAHTMNVASSL